MRLYLWFGVVPYSLGGACAGRERSSYRSYVVTYLICLIVPKCWIPNRNSFEIHQIGKTVFENGQISDYVTCIGKRSFLYCVRDIHYSRNLLGRAFLLHQCRCAIVAQNELYEGRWHEAVQGMWRPRACLWTPLMSRGGVVGQYFFGHIIFFS